MTVVSRVTPSEHRACSSSSGDRRFQSSRTLEPVGVEIQRPGDVILLVLLGDAEIDVEEQERTGRRGLRPPPLEYLSKPFGVDELVVVGKTLHREGLVGRPLGPALLVGSDTRVA